MSPPRLPHPVHHPRATRPGERLAHGARERAHQLQERVGERTPLGRVRRGREGAALQQMLEHAARSQVSAAPWFAEFRAYLEDEIDRDGGDAFLHELRQTTQEKLARLQNVVNLGREIAESFRAVSQRRRLLAEALLPARSGQIDGRTAWNRIDQLARRSVLDEVSRHTPQWTIGIGGNVQGGYGVGGEVALGVCGVRYDPHGWWYVEGNLGAGAIVEAEMSAHVQFAHCKPPQFGGFSVGATLGGAYGASLAVGVAFTPHFHRPSPGAPTLLDWSFNSLTVQVGGGEGIDLSVALGYCHVGPVSGPVLA